MNPDPPDSPEPDESEFKQAMAGVKRMHPKHRDERVARPPERPNAQIAAARRSNATAHARRADEPDHPARPAQQRPGGETGHGDHDNYTEFFHAGPQRKLKRQLKRGEIPVSGTLDLHGLTAAEARKSLETFIARSAGAGNRCVLVIHGKGLRSPDGKGVLKATVGGWLRKHSAVLGYCSAQPRHGGSGALYVLLRKSPA